MNGCWHWLWQKLSCAGVGTVTWITPLVSCRGTSLVEPDAVEARMVACAPAEELVARRLDRAMGPPARRRRSVATARGVLWVVSMAMQFGRRSDGFSSARQIVQRRFDQHVTQYHAGRNGRRRFQVLSKSNTIREWAQHKSNAHAKQTFRHSRQPQRNDSLFFVLISSPSRFIPFDAAPQLIFQLIP